MITLEKFTPLDFDLLKSWINSEEELIQFAGTIFEFPLTDEQLSNYVRMIDRRPLRVLYNASVIGHCELNFQNSTPRLSRILIGEKIFRGKGLGREIVVAMVNEIFKNGEYNQIDLNVFDWNTSAISCYQKVGFTINPKESKVVIVNGKNWTCLNMILYKINFRF
jgi:RimJ/RimL family protein N-acetyltransferase